MHIKHIHETIEKLSKYACDEACKSVEEIDTKELGEVTDMVKDLAEAEYYARISKAMEEAEKEEEEEAKRIMREMKEQYGEEEGERRFYDNYRYANGRFAPKGRGSYVGRRGYEEPPYYRMSPEMYKEHDPSYWRDVDREQLGRMYFPNDGGSSGNMGGSRSGGSMGGNSGNMGGGSSSRGYSDGYSDGMNEGTRRGYEDGRRDGERMGRNSQSRDSRYERAKRGYEETKSMHKSNTAEDKQLTMKEMEKVLNVVFDEIDEMLEDSTPEMKSMVKTKGMARFQKMQ